MRSSSSVRSLRTTWVLSTSRCTSSTWWSGWSQPGGRGLVLQGECQWFCMLLRGSYCSTGSTSTVEINLSSPVNIVKSMFPDTGLAQFLESIVKSMFPETILWRLVLMGGAPAFQSHHNKLFCRWWSRLPELKRALEVHLRSGKVLGDGTSGQAEMADNGLASLVADNAPAHPTAARVPRGGASPPSPESRKPRCRARSA